MMPEESFTPAMLGSSASASKVGARESDAVPSTGYETLIYDAMIGDATLFQRADTIEAGWRVVQPVLDAWAREPSRDLSFYPAGGEGPREADELIQRDGRLWRPLSDGPKLPK